MNTTLMRVNTRRICFTDECPIEVMMIEVNTNDPSTKTINFCRPNPLPISATTNANILLAAMKEIIADSSQPSRNAFPITKLKNNGSDRNEIVASEISNSIAFRIASSAYSFEKLFRSLYRLSVGKAP